MKSRKGAKESTTSTENAKIDDALKQRAEKRQSLLENRLVEYKTWKEFDRIDQENLTAGGTENLNDEQSESEEPNMQFLSELDSQFWHYTSELNEVQEQTTPLICPKCTSKFAISCNCGFSLQTYRANILRIERMHSNSGCESNLDAEFVVGAESQLFLIYQCHLCNYFDAVPIKNI